MQRGVSNFVSGRQAGDRDGGRARLCDRLRHAVRTAVPLSEAQRRAVIGDLAVVGVVSRHPGRPGARLPGATSRLAKLTGATDGLFADERAGSRGSARVAQ